MAAIWSLHGGGLCIRRRGRHPGMGAFLTRKSDGLEGICLAIGAEEEIARTIR